jgi:hypothetical protein
MIAVEDQNGDVGVVALHNSRSTARIPAQDTFVAVKEPYFTPTIHGTVLIRVDHPSDLIHLETDSTLLPLSMATVPVTPFSTTEREEIGNAAMQRCDWETAIDCYSRCLLMEQDDQDLRRNLHLNCSRARMNLGHFELAVQDAAAAIAPGNVSDNVKNRNLKAFCQAGQASYELGNYIDSKQYFSRGLEISSDAHMLGQLQRTMQRLDEISTGRYDFSVMSQSVTKNRNVLDNASFVKNTKVAPAGDRGRGLFAAKHLSPGELIMVEKAFYTTSDQVALGEMPIVANIQEATPVCYQGKYVERIYGTMQKILHNPMQAGQFLDLHDGGRFQNKVPTFVDGRVTIDIFLIEAITRLNAFSCPLAKSAPRGDESEATGIWLHASHANHSCVPNADRSFIGNMMVVRANTDIEVGEEICMSYCNSDDPYVERKQHLSSYGFECDCPLCGTEKTIPLALSERAKIIDETNQFITTHMVPGDVSTLPASTISAAEKLLRRLDDTYPDAKYQHLPRLECIPLSYWLCLVNGTQEEKVERTLNAMRNHGYFITITNNGITVDRTSAVPLAPALMISLIATAVCLQSGKNEAARELQQLRKEIYTNLYACESGFDDMDSQFNR